ncbi:hypothetical protein KBA39_09455 [Myxococcota bacterium]|nr:hypothetical protein [Myxococcota bacterium]
MNRLQKFLLSCVAVSAAMVWLCATPCPAVAQDAGVGKPVVLVSEIRLDGIVMPAPAVDRMTEYLISSMAQTRRYLVVPQVTVDVTMAELKADGRPRSEVELGLAACAKVATNRLVMPTLVRSGPTCRLKVDILDAAEESIIGSDLVALGGCGESAIMAGIRDLVSHENSIFLKGSVMTVPADGSAALSAPAVVVIAELRLDGLNLSSASVKRLDSRLLSVVASTGAYMVVPKAEAQPATDFAAGKDASPPKVLPPAVESDKDDHGSCQISLRDPVQVQKYLLPRIVRVARKCSLIVDAFDLQTEALDDAVMTGPFGCSEADIMSAIESVRGRLSPTDPGKGK